MESQQIEMKNSFLHQIIWGALLMSLFMYTFVTFHSTGEFLFNLEEAENGVVYLFLATMSLVLSVVVPKMLLKKMRAQTFPEALQKFFVPHIIRLVLLESVTLFGMILSFNNEKNYLLPFLIVAVVGFLFAFPSDSKIKKATGLRAS